MQNAHSRNNTNPRHHRLLSLMVVTSMALALFAGTVPCRAMAAAASPVYLLTTVHRRHADLDYFDFDKLRAIVEAIEPDVMVLELTPEELRDRNPFPGKQEYPVVIFPMLGERDYRIYVSEPGEPLFGEVTGLFKQGFSRFQERSPEVASALQDYSDSLRKVMEEAYWKSAADVHDAATDRMFAGLREVRNRLIEGESELQAQWDRYAVEAILDAVRQNRGKRILVLNGIRNRHQLARDLNYSPDVDLIDMDRWLRDRGY